MGEKVQEALKLQFDGPLRLELHGARMITPDARLLACRDLDEALEHLDFAISEFRDMKMQPSLERALRHKEILGA